MVITRWCSRRNVALGNLRGESVCNNKPCCHGWLFSERPQSMKEKRVQTISRKSEKVSPIGRCFMRAHDREIVKSGKISYDESLRNLQMLEAFFVNALKEKPKDALEIKRRIAESRLDLALRKNCSVAVCRARLKALSHLGFTSLERKALFHLIYARGALARGHNRAAKRVSVAIIEELENSLKNRKSRPEKQMLAVARNFLDSFDGI